MKVYWKDTWHNAAAGLRQFLRSRLFGLAALGVATAVAVGTLAINRRTYTIWDGLNSTVVTTTSRDPNDILAQAGISLTDGDQMDVETAAARGDIYITRAFDMTVTADGVTRTLRLTGGTVRDALADAGIVLGPEDILNPTPSLALRDGTTVTVQRVTYTDRTVTEAIPYDTQTFYTPVLAPGRVHMLRAGANGQHTAVYRDRFIDGVLADTVLLSESVTKQPVTALRYMGPARGTPYSAPPSALALDAHGQPLQYRAKYVGTCTAYAGDEPNLAGRLTATGMRPRIGIVAVNPNKIPYGTKLYIVSADGSFCYGYAVAADTGGGVMNGTLIADLWMDYTWECSLFGKRTLTVYVL